MLLLQRGGGRQEAKWGGGTKDKKAQEFPPPHSKNKITGQEGGLRKKEERKKNDVDDEAMEARRRYTSDTCGRSKSRTHEIWKTKKTEKLFLFFVGIHPSAHQDELLLLLLHMFGMMMNDHLNSATHHRDWANVFDLWWSRFPFPPYFLSLPSRANLTDLPTCSGIYPGALQLMNKTTLYLHLNIHACRFDIFTARNLVTTKSPHSGRLNTWHCCKELQVHFFSVSISSRPF